MKKYYAEFIGTLVLVFGGVGSAVLAGDKIGSLGIAFAFGLSLLAMVYTIGPISGCHVNPAVTLGVFLAKKIPARVAAIYVAAQVAGGVAGSALIWIVARGGPHGYSAAASGLGANGFGIHSPAGYAMSSAFLVELILTFLLVFTVLGTTDIKSPVGFAGIAIGLILTLIHLVGIPITNTSVNPARSIGPALFVGGWALAQLWLFIVSPLLGAALAAVCYTAIRGPEVLLTTTRAVSSLTSEQATREETSLGSSN